MLIGETRYKERKCLSFEIIEEIEYFEVRKKEEIYEEKIADEIFAEFQTEVGKETEKVWGTHEIVLDSIIYRLISSIACSNL